MSTPNTNFFKNKNDQTYPNTCSPTRTPVRVPRETLNPQPGSLDAPGRYRPEHLFARTYVRTNICTPTPPHPNICSHEQAFAYHIAELPPTFHTCYRSFGGVGLLVSVLWGFWLGPCPGSLRQFRLIACQLSALCVGWSCPPRPWGRRISGTTRWPL